MRARFLPVVVAVCVAVGGCSGSEPDAGPTLPPVTSTPSASPNAVAVPTEATAATPEGAAEFARFFYAQVEMAYATRDPELISALSTPNCETCNLVINAVTRLRDEDAQVVDYRVSVDDAVAPTTTGSDEQATVTTTLTFSEFVRLDAQGKETNREPARQAAVQDVILARSGVSGWRVQEVRSS